MKTHTLYYDYYHTVSPPKMSLLSLAITLTYTKLILIILGTDITFVPKIIKIDLCMSEL